MAGRIELVHEKNFYVLMVYPDSKTGNPEARIEFPYKSDILGSRARELEKAISFGREYAKNPDNQLEFIETIKEQK